MNGLAVGQWYQFDGVGRGNAKLEANFPQGGGAGVSPDSGPIPNKIMQPHTFSYAPGKSTKAGIYFLGESGVARMGTKYISGLCGGGASSYAGTHVMTFDLGVDNPTTWRVIVPNTVSWQNVEDGYSADSARPPAPVGHPDSIQYYPNGEPIPMHSYWRNVPIESTGAYANHLVFPGFTMGWYEDSEGSGVTAPDGALYNARFCGVNLTTASWYPDNYELSPGVKMFPDLGTPGGLAQGLPGNPIVKHPIVGTAFDECIYVFAASKVYVFDPRNPQLGWSNVCNSTAPYGPTYWGSAAIDTTARRLVLIAFNPSSGTPYQGWYFNLGATPQTAIVPVYFTLTGPGGDATTGLVYVAGSPSISIKPGFVYNDVLDCFILYQGEGTGGAAPNKRIWTMKKNNGNTFDVQLMGSFTAVAAPAPNATPPEAVAHGTPVDWVGGSPPPNDQNFGGAKGGYSFQYFPTLGGVGVIQNTPAGGDATIYFLRTNTVSGGSSQNVTVPVTGIPATVSGGAMAASTAGNSPIVNLTGQMTTTASGFLSPPTPAGLYPQDHFVPTYTEMAPSDYIGNAVGNSVYYEGVSWRLTVGGASRLGYVPGAFSSEVKWDNIGGDYFDKNGARVTVTSAFGSSNAYASYAWVGAHQGTKTFTFSGAGMTQLVKDLITNNNYGIGVLRIGGTTGPVYLVTKWDQVNVSLRPSLTITDSVLGTATIPVDRNGVMDASSTAPTGVQNTQCRISNSTNMIMWWDLRAYTNAANITSATLTLNSTDQFGNMTLGLFRVCCPQDQASMSPQRAGLAANYPLDANIINDPDVLFVEQFTSPNYVTNWSYPSTASEQALNPDGSGLLRGAQQTTDDPSKGFTRLLGQFNALKYFMATGSTTVYNQKTWNDLRWSPWRQKGLHVKGRAHEDELYFRYYYMFANDWNPGPLGGKLAGWEGNFSFGTAEDPLYMTNGNSGQGVDGFTGWTVRGAWSLPPNPLGTTPDLVRLNSYNYNMDQDGAAFVNGSSYGESTFWNKNWLNFFRKNTWYCVEQHIKLNSVVNLPIINVAQAQVTAVTADVNRDTSFVPRTNTTQAGSTASTIVLDLGADSRTDRQYYVGHPVWCNARPNEKRLIASYNGATRVATITSLSGTPTTWDNIPGVESYTVDYAYGNIATVTLTLNAPDPNINVNDYIWLVGSLEHDIDCRYGNNQAPRIISVSADRLQITFQKNNYDEVTRQWVKRPVGFVYTPSPQITYEHNQANFDGVLEVWVNGFQVAGYYNFRWRQSMFCRDNVTPQSIDAVWLDLYGNDTQNGGGGTVYLSNIVVAKKYIGPILSP